MYFSAAKFYISQMQKSETSTRNYNWRRTLFLEETASLAVQS